MAREFSRSDRIASQIQRELADLLRTEIRDSTLGMITVSDVEVTRDLAVAKAYVTFLGASFEPKPAIKRLNEFVPMLRHELGKRMRLRVMPEIRFVHDESIARGQRMDELLAGLHTATDDDKDSAE